MKSLDENELNLRNKIIDVIKSQGFKINPHVRPIENNKDTYRQIQSKARNEHLFIHQSFIKDNLYLIKNYTRNGPDISPQNITLELREVKPNSFEEIIFRWWNLIWWSVPYQRPYGRQMRFVLWDTYHNSPFGLIGLQSPVLKMSVRDKALDIPKNELDTWINQSMQAQRLGALPPYNALLGGKMVALSITCNEIRELYKEKYLNSISIIKNRIIEPRLLFITTTSAFGRSSIYNRLKYKDEYVAKSLGFTKGSGTFHIPEELYLEILKYLENKGVNTHRCFGYGPSKRIKLLTTAFRYLEIKNYVYHNLKREFFIFPLVKNLNEIIKDKQMPEYYNRPFEDLFDYWRTRWCLPRSTRKDDWNNFSKDYYFNEIIESLR